MKDCGDRQNIGSLMCETDMQRGEVIGSWFTEGTICLFYGLRGSGKSTFAMGMALAAAHKTPFLLDSWIPAKKYRVLYFDSEMGNDSLRRKFREVDSASRVSLDMNTSIDIVTPKHMGGRAWNISNAEHQMRINKMLESADVLIIDNLLGMCRPCFRGDTETSVWERTQDWLIPLRDSGKAILILHHTAKSGDQYGTIMKENAMDSIVKITEVKGAEVDGLAIDWHFTKGRWLYGAQKRSLRVTYEKFGDGQRWTCCSLDQARSQEVNRRFKMGWSKKDIASDLGLSDSEVKIYLNGGSMFTNQTSMPMASPNEVENNWEYDT